MTDITDAVRSNIAGWIDLAEKGEIDWETATQFINAFDLGMAELAKAVGGASANKDYRKAYNTIVDSHQYIVNKGHPVKYPPLSTDLLSIKRISKELEAVTNIESRKLHKDIEERMNKRRI